VGAEYADTRLTSKLRPGTLRVDGSRHGEVALPLDRSGKSDLTKVDVSPRFDLLRTSASTTCPDDE
jgi:hypothetical protein